MQNFHFSIPLGKDQISYHIAYNNFSACKNGAGLFFSIVINRIFDHQRCIKYRLKT